MTEADPAAAPSKATMLEADRARQKAIRAASQPFFALGICCLVAAIVLGCWGIMARNAQDAVLAVPFFICIGALCHGVAGILSARWIRKHPPQSQG